MMEQVDLEIRTRAYALWERWPAVRPEPQLSLEAERLVHDAHKFDDFDEGLEGIFPASDTPPAVMRAGKSS